MKALKIMLSVTVVLLLGATMGWAQKVPKSTIAGSVHDLRPAGAFTPVPGGAPYTLCSFCHVAHKTAQAITNNGGAANVPGPLLWNHTLSSKASYGVYGSATFNSYSTDISDVGAQNNASTFGVSNLCLSCHDGTVSVASWYVAPGNKTYTGALVPDPTMTMMADTTINDLSKTHPVHFTYDAALAAKAGLLTPAGTNGVDSATSPVVPLFSGKMECATCHDPHNGKSGIFARPFPAQTSGTWCTYCHL